MFYNAMAMIVNFSLAEKLPTTPTPKHTNTHNPNLPENKNHFIWLTPKECMEERGKGTSGNMDQSLLFLTFNSPQDLIVDSPL